MRIRIFLHPFQASLLVVLIKIIKLDDAYQLLGITGIGGIAGFLQAPRPALVIGDLELEKRSITRTTDQKLRMVIVGLLGVLVCTETFVSFIIIMTDGLASPITSTLDSEVVVRLASQCALSGSRLQLPLCQSDTGRDVILLHLLNGYVAVFLDVFFVLFVACLRLKAEYAQEASECQYQSIHKGLQVISAN